MGNSAQSNLDRNRDLLLNLFGCPSGKERDDLNLGIRDIGKRFDRQGPKRRDTTSRKERYQQDQEERLVERKRNDAPDHSLLLSVERVAEQQNAACDDSIVSTKTPRDHRVTLKVSCGLHILLPEAPGRCLHQYKRL